MNVIEKGLFSAGFTVWNAFIQVARQFFTTDPTGGSTATAFSTVKTLYGSICNAVAPLASIFFIIAIFKSVTSSPPENQAVQFLKDTIKYCIILYLSTQMLTIMELIMNFCTSITQTFNNSLKFTNTMTENLDKAIDTVNSSTTLSVTDIIKTIVEFIPKHLIVFISGLVFILICSACGIQLLNFAFSRVLKPLMIIPFAGIALATGAGSRDEGRTLAQYLRTYFGYCISGALMIVCLYVSTLLCSSIPQIDYSSLDPCIQVLMICIQGCATPIVTTGLVKASDEVVSKIF